MNLFKFPFFSHEFINNPKGFTYAGVHSIPILFKKKCFLLNDLETILVQVMVVKRFVDLLFYNQCMQDSYGSIAIIIFMRVH